MALVSLTYAPATPYCASRACALARRPANYSILLVSRRYRNPARSVIANYRHTHQGKIVEQLARTDRLLLVECGDLQKAKSSDDHHVVVLFMIFTACSIKLPISISSRILSLSDSQRAPRAAVRDTAAAA